MNNILKNILAKGSVKIQEHIIDVNLKDGFSGEGILGQSNSITSEIEILKNLSSSMKEETLLHEILHIISYNFNLELNETQVCGISNVLYSVLMNNDKTKIDNRGKVAYI